MAYEIGFVDASGTEGIAHKQMLLKLKTLCEANGWTTLRYDNVSAIRELILHSTGLSGTEDIYIGFRSYENVSADYYNLSVAGFTGYVSSNSFATQPGYYESGIPAHNNRIDYWVAVNAQRVAMALKVGTPVYESGYVGKILPYGTPTQYPYPLAVGGMLAGLAATRYSDTNQSMPFKGNNLRLRTVAGAWLAPAVWPYQNDRICGSTQGRDTSAYYPLRPLILTDANNVYGELEGVYQVSGFNNAVENVVQDGGVDYPVIQDVFRTGFNDYFALRMQ